MDRSRPGDLSAEPPGEGVDGKRIGPTLLVGQLTQPTGMARVMRALAQALAMHRPTHLLAIDAYPGTDPAAAVVPGCTVHPNPIGYDVFGEQELAHVCRRLRPRSVILYHDHWFMPRFRRAIPKGPAVVGYCPIDRVPWTGSTVRSLGCLDGVAVPTNFAAGMPGTVMKAVPPDSRPALPRLAVIAHGIDRDVFGPLPVAQRRVEARRALFPERPELWHGFWVANVNRNHPRKRLDLTLRGFARFAADKPPDVRLYMHWGEEAHGPTLRSLARRLGIEKRLLTSPRKDGLSSSELNLVYNAADVGVNTSLAEGWGLPAFEHALTRAPQIVPAHGACEELWEGSAALLPVRSTSNQTMWPEGGEVHPDDLAANLERLYRDPRWYDVMARSGERNALKSAYRWPRIAATWDAWLRQVEAETHSCRS